jgi:hypothetical protein
MLHVAFDRFNEIGNQVMTPGELDVNLGERIFDAISEIDQTIVDADRVEDYCGKENQQ